MFTQQTQHTLICLPSPTNKLEIWRQARPHPGPLGAHRLVWETIGNCCVV